MNICWLKFVILQTPVNKDTGANITTTLYNLDVSQKHVYIKPDHAFLYNE